MNRAWRSFTYFTSPTIYRTLAFAVLLTSCVVLATHVVRWRRAGIREHPDFDQVHAALMQAAESLGGHDPAGQTKLGELAERLRRQDGGDFPWPAGPVAGVAVSLLALAAESRLARLLRRRTMHGNFQGMGRTRRDDKHPMLSTLYNTLFRYRLTNPDEERFRSELRLARQIQFNMTPEQSSSPPAASPDYDIDALLAPAEEVGGDFYDYFLHADGRLVLAVGDVAGHGMAAAMYMAACRTAFRALAETSPDPSVLLGRLNDTMVRDHRSGMYVTIACFFLTLASGEVEYVLAGHPPQLWNRDGGKNWDYVDQPRETVIGVRAGVEYPMGRLTLQPGDALLLFTDGVAEARDARGEELGYPALLQHCRQAAPDQKCGDMIMNLALWLNTYTGGVEQEDDITLLALRFRPDAGPTQENRDCGKTPS